MWVTLPGAYATESFGDVYAAVATAASASAASAASATTAERVRVPHRGYSLLGGLSHRAGKGPAVRTHCLLS